MKDNFTLTPAQQFDNICALRDYLKSEVNPANFYMGYFRSDNSQRRKYFYNKDNCGTCGCALGWAPFVRGLKPVISDYGIGEASSDYLDFGIYSERVFGIPSPSFQWKALFGYLGNPTNNTLEVVIKRLDNYILTTGSN